MTALRLSVVGLVALFAFLAAPTVEAEGRERHRASSRSVCKAKKKKKKADRPAGKEESEPEEKEDAPAEAEKSVKAEKSEKSEGPTKAADRGVSQAATGASQPESESETEAPPPMMSASQKSEAEGRKTSKITPGSASRWSNKGAMTPIESEVPITVGLPERAIPVAPGVETPGQNLTGEGELLEARIHFAYSHLETRGQDITYTFPAFPNGGPVTTPDRNRDIDLLRGRATMAYERIADSQFGVHLDLEYRPRLSGSRPTDHRLNELYVSYGLTDFRRRDDLSFGVAVGRVAVREAGYAQADGALFRLRMSKEWTAGVFGGVTGNPYGYNWALRKDEEFSADWLRGGAFVGYRGLRAFANFAAVATYSLTGKGLVAGSRTPGSSGLDRLYAYADASYLLTDTLNLMATGWIDVVGGHPLQSVELVAAYRPQAELDFRLGVGRFSTILYDSTAAYAFAIDPLGNAGSVNGGVLVDANGVPVLPFDAVIGSTIYNSIRLRGGYQIMLPLEAYANFDVLMRDTSYTDAFQQVASGATLPVADLRLTPGAGVKYHDPDIVDAALELMYIVDGESQADAMVRGALGRGLYGVYLSLDARHFFGDIDATDTGADLSYTLPREWFPGRVILRAMFRYYRENLALSRPVVGSTANSATSSREFVLLPFQESYLGYFSLEWRL